MLHCDFRFHEKCIISKIEIISHQFSKNILNEWVSYAVFNSLKFELFTKFTQPVRLFMNTNQNV